MSFTPEQQAEVDRIVGVRLARAEKRAPEPTPPPSPKQSETPSNAEADPTLSLMAFQDTIDELPEGTKIPQGLKKRMRADYLAAPPQDPNAWVNAWLVDAGIKTTTVPATNQAPNGESPKASTVNAAPPISDKGPPTGSREFDQITHVKDLTAGDIERLQAKHGEEQANDMILALALRSLANVKFKP